MNDNNSYYTTIKTAKNKSPERVFLNIKNSRPTTPILIPSKNKTYKNRSVSAPNLNASNIDYEPKLKTFHSKQELTNYLDSDWKIDEINDKRDSASADLEEQQFFNDNFKTVHSPPPPSTIDNIIPELVYLRRPVPVKPKGGKQNKTKKNSKNSKNSKKQKTNTNTNTNVNGTVLKPCSFYPITGFSRDGYCKPFKNDSGNHLVCANLNKAFMDFTASKGNDLSSVAKPGDNWCLCQHRYFEAYLNKKQPKVIKNATHSFLQDEIKNAIDKQKGGNKSKKNIKGKKKKTRKMKFLFNPDDPKKSFDVYIDKDPSDTIPIKYTSLDDVKNTILKLEGLYKKKLYTHKRIWQVAMIMKVRLGVIYQYRNKMYKNAKQIKERYELANKYFAFLGSRSKEKDEENRLKMKFVF